ncbi:MAG: tRNA guanosine(34) transglycosylase Tgt [Candidatus Moranbacteria bacterium]|nr:tRNA guanosine(34) transglycosylase Tgt [Candidatus Moranbacteria bacterium]
MFEKTILSGGGRVGKLTTRKGVLTTPFFMPDATRASVRGLAVSDIQETGTLAMVVNTYHLYLQPGIELIKKTQKEGESVGDVHAFMGWNGPLLSDSGGYQIYSLIHKHAEMGRISDEGAEFRSVLDGSKHLITPERAIAIQFDLGTDMIVCLDDPRPNDATREEIVKAVDRTLQWAERCRAEFDRQCEMRSFDETTRPLLFSVVQGGMYVDERQRCAHGLASIGFDGYGFGGRHIDDEGNFLVDILAATAAAIPENSPRFALGIGTPFDIVRCHALGWDMFDCVIPTREGRHGRLFLWTKPQIQNLKLQFPNQVDPDFYWTINIQNEQFKEDFSPVDPTCDCELCRQYTRAYLKHLFKVADPLAGRLASMHNLRFYMRLMKALRGEED